MHENNSLFNDSNIYDTSKNTDNILDEIMISAVYTKFCATHATHLRGVTG